LIEGTGFSLQIPANWSDISAETGSQIRTGKVVFASVSPEKKYGFSNNIIVLQENLQSPITSRKYSELNMAQTAGKYMEYTKISDELLLFSDSDESRVYVFEAKYNANTPRLKFIQTTKMCDMDIYLLHATVALDKDPKSYIDVFRTFRCK
jgi:hypothetical protein